MNRLAYYRQKADMTQTELAKETGIDISQISRVEKDVSDFPGKRWKAIAKTLGCTVDELLESD